MKNSDVKIVEFGAGQEELWEDFCLKSDDAWFWHTRKWSEYCAAYRESPSRTIDCSFWIADHSGLLAVCPLFVEKRVGPNGAAYTEVGAAGSGGLMIVPALRNDLTEDRRESILKAAFECIDSVARKNGAARAMFRITPLGARIHTFNWLLKQGCLDASLNTQILDLSDSLQQTWSGLRKGHKYDVNRGRKNFDVHIFDRLNPDKEIFEQYRLFHHKASGRITRPLETFEMMYNWILEGNGMLCGVSRKGVYAGFSYIILYKDGAYYASSSDDPDFITDIPISHVIQWSVIEWLKEKGFRNYEIGQQQFGPSFCDFPSPKELNISLFKRGFGGRTVPAYRGLRYYDKNYMEADLKKGLSEMLQIYQV